MDYLKDKQHYIDRYDLHTIEECLDTVKRLQDVYQKSLASDQIPPAGENCENCRYRKYMSIYEKNH